MSDRPSADIARPLRLGPDDPQYRAVVDKRFNKRFTSTPDYARIVTSTEQVVASLEDAVAEDRGRGGCNRRRDVPRASRRLGHRHPARRISRHRNWRARRGWRIRFSLPRARARSGLSLRRRSRDCEQGEPSDHDGRDPRSLRPESRAVVGDTGGGGGNFGIVTRYWFRSANATSDDPAKILPRAPESVTTFRAEWSWSDMDEPSFLRLLQNHGRWSEQNSGADSANASAPTPIMRQLSSRRNPRPHTSLRTRLSHFSGHAP